MCFFFKVLPFRARVLRALAQPLDDRKRLVRLEAVQARAEWYVVEKPQRFTTAVLCSTHLVLFASRFLLGSPGGRWLWSTETLQWFFNQALGWWKGPVPGLLRPPALRCLLWTHKCIWTNGRVLWKLNQWKQPVSTFSLHESKCNFTLNTEGRAKGRIYHILVSLNNY